MTDEEINQAVNDFIKNHLSPKQEQREYISKKYEELKEFLGGSCFQSGSYARFTATDPVHDLDVIHPTKEVEIQSNPKIVIDSLYALLTERYANSTITKIKRIYRQTHSITIEFADSPEPFSIDVVPAIELSNQPNEYGEPFYSVPEVLNLNKFNREKRYQAAEGKPIGWIKSDPRGYIRATTDLNNANSDFRHTAKLLKSWRQSCKNEYGEDFSFKSFHLEQIIFIYFQDNPETTTTEAIIDCLAAIPDYLNEPQIPDRADSSRYIDEYIQTLTDSEKKLILQLQSKAYAIARQLPACNSIDEIEDKLTELCTVDKEPFSQPPTPTRIVSPRQPWASYRK